jgi:tripartite-type tricarboxylate transporter receptor subunit TctC
MDLYMDHSYLMLSVFARFYDVWSELGKIISRTNGVAFAKANPDKVNYASVGNGSIPHLTAEMFSQRAGIKMTHVPYKGAGPALSDVMSNQVPAVLGTLSGAMSHIKNGKIKPIAVTSSQRSPQLPDVPTMAESGVAGYESDTWIGMFVPKKTPDAIVQKIHRATIQALNDPSVKTRFDSLAGRIIGGGPAELDTLVSIEIKQFTQVVKDQGIKPE